MPFTQAKDFIGTNPDLEVFTMNVQFEKIGNYSLPAIYNGITEDVYLPFVEIVDLLKISLNTSSDGDTISGFLSNNKNPFTIDIINKTLIVNDTHYQLNIKDFLYDKGVLMLSLKVFNQILACNINFNFRNLNATFSFNNEPPVLRLGRLEYARKTLKQKHLAVQSDTLLQRDYHLFKGGMLDWAFTGNQYGNGMGENRFSLAVGSEVLGGQADIFLNYSDRYGFNINQQQYHWRWVNDQFKYLRQVQLGRIYTPNISSVLYPLDGFSITNAPATVRKVIGDYLISDHTHPNSVVELYINNVLVDFIVSDASGFYTFKIPIGYGSSVVTLRFYSPNGEEHDQEKVIYNPYNFLPNNELEYKVVGGILLNNVFSQYVQAEVNYGVTRWLTIGAGVEYLSSILNNSPYIPFTKASLQPLPKLILTTEYAHNVRTKATLNYSTPKNVSLELNYSNYTLGQTAIIYNYKAERSAIMSFPFRVKKINGYAKAAFRQNLYAHFGFNASELSLSGNYLYFNSNLSSYFNWTNAGLLNVYTNLAIGCRINTNLNARLYTQFNYTRKSISSYKAEFEKRILDKGYLAIGYENHLINHFRSVNLTFRYDLTCLSSYFSSNFTNKKVQFSESIRGSLMLGNGNNYVYADKLTTVGKCGMLVIPYVDINHNGVFDTDERKVCNLRLKINGGQVFYSEKDSTVRITGLDPFVNYQLTIDELSLENLSWHIPYKNMSVTTDPNQLKRIELAIKPMGEVMGTTVNQNNATIARVLLHIRDVEGKAVKSIITENDGYFSFLGLTPGNYTISADAAQLERLKCDAKTVSFVIKQDPEGDILDVGDIVLYKVSTINSEN